MSVNNNKNVRLMEGNFLWLDVKIIRKMFVKNI